MTVGSRIVLEPDSAVVWFSFPGAAHDLGLFHRADATCTGIYANILTPLQLHGRYDWETTDLFLDLWLCDGQLDLLDEDELVAALGAGQIDAKLAAFARAEASRLRQAWQAGDWPPAIVMEWPLERARAVARGTPPAR